MAEELPEAIDDPSRFRRFRLHVIEFLKLPHDIGEDALLDVLKRANTALFRAYQALAGRGPGRLPEADGSD